MAVIGLARAGRRFFPPPPRPVTQPERHVPLVIPVQEAAIEDLGEPGAASVAFFTKCSSQEQYEWLALNQGELFQARLDFEARLIPAGDCFELKGYCAACKQETTFFVDSLSSSGVWNGKHILNWREHLVCRHCKLLNRLRAIIDFIERDTAPDNLDPMYVTEQTTTFYSFLRQRYPNTIGSEFIDDGTALGQTNLFGIRNEDLTELSLGDASVNVICTNEVLEHIPDYPKAVSECFRVLKPGGALIISVPFILHNRETIVRARRNPDGSIDHLLPAEYHGDGQSAEGVLCYYHFGWDLLDCLRGAGFSDSALYFYWSARLGYLGTPQFLLCAKKP